jgi:hypothetical protein
MSINYLVRVVACYRWELELPQLEYEQIRVTPSRQKRLSVTCCQGS